jgi:hypothetical protein
MESNPADENVKILAHSPGKYPILVVELPSGVLRAAYFETGYDLGHAKPVERTWLTENALGRHSFVEVNPPAETTAGSLTGYVRKKLLRGS